MNGEFIRERAEALFAWTRDARHGLHRIPEIGFEVPKSLAFLKSKLDEASVPYQATDCWITAEIKGGRPGRTVGIRADFDALPIQEETGLPYASEHPGKMHACGHDAHAAILLGTARLLHSIREEIPGTVRLFFQPAEETVGGALPMIKAGVMRGVDAVYALHVTAQAQVGRVTTKPGAVHAACDELIIDILGKSGHGAHPRTGVDAVTIAAHVINGLNTLVPRELEATEQAVLSIGSIRGGHTNNILCGEVKMHGTLRTLDPLVRDQFGRRIPELCEGIARALNGDAWVEVRRGYSACVNDETEARRALATAVGLFGAELVTESRQPSMGGEDFGYFLKEAPGAMYYLGCGSDAPLHNEHFTVHDECLPRGIMMHAAVALSYLAEHAEDQRGTRKEPI